MPLNIIELSNRLSDGREIKTDADFSEWVYETINNFTQQIGEDRTPIDVFPAITRVMVEWIEVTGGGKENAQALPRAIGTLTGALKKCLKDLNEENPPPPPPKGDAIEDAMINAAVEMVRKASDNEEED